MTVARESLIDYESTHFYHCICRCVRRAFLCGKDEMTGKSFEHRRQWLKRLTSISWFMGSVNQYIASKANAEDKCTGHFWESRFKSQALLDEMAILGCMMYVDLNPVRAGIAQNLTDSDFTSIQARIRAFAEAQKQTEQAQSEADDSTAYQPEFLLPFAVGNNANGIAFDLVNYLSLADWAGRCVHPKKKGFIDQHQEALLKTLDIDEADWLEMTRNYEGKFAGFAGKASKLYVHANQHGQFHCKGVG